jgi:predicted metal-binding membrane protein
VSSTVASRPAALWLPWRSALIATLLVLAAVAWWATAARMGGMDMGPGTDPGALGFYLTTWVVMMAAMMFPSVGPMVSTYARLHRGREARGLSTQGGVAMLLGGYLASWTAWGLLAYGALRAGRALDGGALAWDRGGRWLASGVLLLAAGYELTPLKDACLTRCRSPFAYLVGSWRGGRWGALRMGVEHGAWCVGCCWGLMAALLALGAMSLGWMAFVAALIALEKLVPWRAGATVAVTAVLAALAIGVAAAPGSVPGLTVPASSGQMAPAMHSR